MSPGTTSHRRGAGETVNEEADGRILEQRKEHDAREKNTTQTLSDLIRGLQHSVNAAMEMVETRNVELLGRYFSPEGDPLTKRLNIDSQTAVDVPLISIVNPSTVNIKEVEMEFSVQINSSDLRCKQPQKGFQAGDQQAVFDNRLKRSSLEISFDGQKDLSRMQVRIKFEAKPIPEGLSRTIDEYDKTIMPFTRVGENQ
ncbi:DUF2589 domain-containing protein [uncultured Alistipes sp.]|uniref:DUF2589 domain-containing protein n=1 Tax=uncultured Alistipes sp. TaxID=538949 RepID=UPI00320B95C8